MGRKNRKSKAVRVCDLPHVRVLPTASVIEAAGVKLQLWEGVSPDGTPVVLAVLASVRFLAEDGKGRRDTYEIDALPEEIVVIVRSKVEAMQGTASPLPAAKGEEASRLLASLMEGVPAGRRGEALAQVAARCGFTAGDAFSFLDALPAEQERSR